MSTFKLASPVVRCAFASAVVMLVAGCANTPAPGSDPCATAGVVVNDPAERVNRGLFSFNRTLDDYALEPVARGYRKLPDMVQTGVHNFVANFGEPKVFINDLLQGNGERSVTTFGRFVINSTVGIVGLIDVSGKMGIARHKADFGQTFGVWNLANGPIVELPLFGTSNLRDATGRLLSFAVAPLGDSDAVETLGTVSTVGGIVDGRAEVLPVTDALSKKPDYYLALRDTVAQRRAEFVREGKSGLVGAPLSQCASDEASHE